MISLGEWEVVITVKHTHKEARAPWARRRAAREKQTPFHDDNGGSDSFCTMGNESPSFPLTHSTPAATLTKAPIQTHMHEALDMKCTYYLYLKVS